MQDAGNDVEITLIEKLRPALTGKNPRERLSLFFCLSLAGFFSIGIVVGYFAGFDFTTVDNIIYRAVMLGLILIVCATITLLSTLIFIKTFQGLLSSLDSKEESQQTERAAHKKAARP